MHGALRQEKALRDEVRSSRGVALRRDVQRGKRLRGLGVAGCQGLLKKCTRYPAQRRSSCVCERSNIKNSIGVNSIVLTKRDHFGGHQTNFDVLKVRQISGAEKTRVAL